MNEFLKAFHRNDDGSWTCVAAARYQSAEGRIEVAPGTTFTKGTVFLGVEIASWLEQQLKHSTVKAA